MSIIYLSLYTTLNVPSYNYICVLILLQQGMECGTFFFSFWPLSLSCVSVILRWASVPPLPPFSPLLV